MIPREVVVSAANAVHGRSFSTPGTRFRIFFRPRHSRYSDITFIIIATSHNTITFEPVAGPYHRLLGELRVNERDGDYEVNTRKVYSVAAARRRSEFCRRVDLIRDRSRRFFLWTTGKSLISRFAESNPQKRAGRIHYVISGIAGTKLRAWFRPSTEMSGVRY